MSKKMCKNGFTLVELLAILVVLGVIAIIIVPRIVSTIDNSKMDSAIVSAKGYMDSVIKLYVEKNTPNYDNLGNKDYGLEINGIYSIENGILKRSGESISIPFTGAPPKSGRVLVIHGEVISGCLTIGKYSVVINESNVIRAVDDTCENVIADYPGEVRNDNYKYFDEPLVVYYNPLTDELCSAGSSSSMNGFSSGCMKWYGYSVKGNVVNMILDHNINKYNDLAGEFVSVKAISSDDYSNGSSLATSLGVSNIGDGTFDTGNYDKGPLTALNYLKDKTSDWISSVSGDYSSYTANSGTALYSVDYSIYKARLITAEEVFYTKQATVGTGVLSGLGGWLSDNLQASKEGINFYWTVTPSNSGVGFYTVGLSGLNTSELSPTNLSIQERWFGIRPVVSLDFDRASIFVK